MHAAIHERTGPAADVLQLVELPDPHPAAGEVRVRLRWSGINPSDVNARDGRRGKDLPHPMVVPHSDGMGVVDEVGDGVSPARLGERVWTWNAAWNALGGRQFGTAAQYVVLPAAQAVSLPEAVPDEAGACLGVPAMTAMHAVLVAGGVAGRRVLVAGGAGAVGRYAVQFARLLGASQVLATASTAEKQASARAAGAQAVVDYRDAEATAARVHELTAGEGVDRVIELDVAANAAFDLQVLRHGGDIVVYGSSDAQPRLPYRQALEKNASLHCFLVYTLAPLARQQVIDRLTEVLTNAAVDHAIAERRPLAEIVQAHQAVERKAAMGKVVLSIP